MKKRLLLLLPMVLLTGCVRIDNSLDNYELLINNTLNTITIQNKASNGYKYYLPKGVNLVSNLDFNQVFSYNDVNMYMYVDVVSYYYKSQNYEKDDDYLYYKDINNLGYLAIKEENNIYYVNVSYNYARIELYTNKENLNNVITESLIILNSIKYNDTIIETIINNNLVNYDEIDYKLDKPSDSTSNFDKYLSEYVQKETEVVELPED